MQTRRLLLTLVASFFLLIALVSYGAAQNNTQLARLQELPRDFHGAFTLGDYELMHSLWSEDATFSNPVVDLVGPEAIADFFASDPGWGKVVSLAPNYKTMIKVHGDLAYFEFECILVNVGEADPLTTSLSTLPPGGQNPTVEIVAHLNASGIAVKKGDRWYFKSFTGSGGPIVP